MRVRMLADVEFDPRFNPEPSRATRCWGQLKLRASRMTTEDGKDVCGPVVRYFPRGSIPEIDDAAAQELIDAGKAERMDDDGVRFVSTDEILDRV